MSIFNVRTLDITSLISANNQAHKNLLNQNCSLNTVIYVRQASRHVFCLLNLHVQTPVCESLYLQELSYICGTHAVVCEPPMDLQESLEESQARLPLSLLPSVLMCSSFGGRGFSVSFSTGTFAIEKLYKKCL